MSPLNVAICTTISYTLWVELFDLEVKGQGPTKVITVRQKSYGPDKFRWEEAEEKIRLKQCLPLFEEET
jgi:hypothetical protein